MPDGPIRVLVCDDQSVVRAGYATILSAQPDLEVVGEASNGAVAVAEARRLGPDVIVMDIQMPVVDGIEATRRLAGPEVDGATAPKVLIVTTFNLASRSAKPVRPLPRTGSAPPWPSSRTSSTRMPSPAPGPGHSTYLEAGGFLPGHTVTLTLDGKAITTLHASTLGNVTYMISPSLLHLPGGSHALSLGSLLITETASFSS